MNGTADHDATALARLVQAGELSPLELVDEAIDRIERLNPVLGFLAGHDFDTARERAAALGTSGPFAGVPTLLKDLATYPGMRFSMGSRVLADNIADAGSDYSQRLDDAGLVTLGKSTTSEFGLLGATETVLEGITRNPWSLAHSPAGSSGGAAAAVASGAVPIAHASDGGGSVRIPASVCGLFGLKPSRGRNVSHEAQPRPQPLDLVANHCVSRSVRDSARYLSVTERRGASALLPPIGYVEPSSPVRLKIAYFTQTLSGGEPHQDVIRAAESTRDLCSELGHDVVEVAPPPVDWLKMGSAFALWAGARVAAVEDLMLPQYGRPLGTDELEPITLDWLHWYREQPPEALPAAVRALEVAAEQVSAYFEATGCDVTLSPTMGRPPLPIGIFDGLGLEEALPVTSSFASYTPIHNLVGAPAMSVPLYWNEDGLPIGTHFAAEVGEEATLLRLAYQLEEARPWAQRRPPVSAE